MIDPGLMRYILPEDDFGEPYVDPFLLELQGRASKINNGKLHSTEVDFAAFRNSDIRYIRFTADMTNESTPVREM